MMEYADISSHSLRFTFADSTENFSGQVQGTGFAAHSCNVGVLFDASQNVAPGNGFLFSYNGKSALLPRLVGNNLA